MPHLSQLPKGGPESCGGVTRSEKALVSQCALRAPIGVPFRQKALRYQRTARSVLNRAGQPPACPVICRASQAVRAVLERAGSCQQAADRSWIDGSHISHRLAHVKPLQHFLALMRSHLAWAPKLHASILGTLAPRPSWRGSAHARTPPGCEALPLCALKANQHARRRWPPNAGPRQRVRFHRYESAVASCAARCECLARLAQLTKRRKSE